jgi:hypothetical protein
MNVSRRVVVVLVVAATVGLALAAGPLFTPEPEVERSTYGYSVVVDTDATLEGATFYVPLPATANGSSPVADAIRRGDVEVPAGWRYDVVETEHGRALRLDAGDVVAERRPDGNRYSTYEVGLSVPSEDVLDTSDPFGDEPTIAPVEDRRVRPCPNVADPDSGKTCYAFDAFVYAEYDAPPTASVGVILVHNGVNVYQRGGHDMYYERLQFTLRGPQDGWVAVDGFASADDPA